MPLKPAPILISDSVYHILPKFSKSRTLPARQVERAKIFILCADGLNNLQISEKVSIGQDSVSKWRIRFLKSLPLLREIEEKSPAELEDKITSILSDYARSGQPPTYTDEQIIKILEIACRSPEEYGYDQGYARERAAYRPAFCAERDDGHEAGARAHQNGDGDLK